MKKYANLEEKVNHVLVDVIRDIEPSQLQKMKNALLLEYSNRSANIDELIRRARQLLVGTEKSQLGRNYWLCRGWSRAVAQAKLVTARKTSKRKISPFSQEFWLNRINENTGQYFTPKEAEFKRNSLRPIRPEYWIIRGLSEEEAGIKAKQTKQMNNRLGNQSMRSKDPDEIKSFSRRCKEYWLARGMNDEDAQQMVKIAQKTFSLEKCIARYGEDDGYNVWKNRQEKWMATINSKSPDEIDRINRLKISHGYSISKAEIEILQCIREVLPNVQDQVIVKCANRCFIFDIGIGKKLIEYNGTFWHADPRFYSEDDMIKGGATAKDIRLKDDIKLKTAKNQGYQVLVIWEYDYKQDKQREINKCINFLTS